LPIKFGSDGWRGIIGREFTLDNVARITAAVCEWWPEDKEVFAGEIYVGYDNRELSHEAAIHACRVIKLLRPEMTPMLTFAPCPSPYISWATHRMKRPLGIQITASHNPPDYNGVKLKGRHGGSLLAKEVKVIEEIANSASPPSGALPEAMSSYDQDPEEFSYEMQISKLAGVRYVPDLDPEEKGWLWIFDALSGQKLIVDQMHGSTDWYLNVLQTVTSPQRIERLRCDRDPLFGGSKPEPLEHLLPELIQRVKEANDGTVGIAFDGDGDRLAVVDETGAYLQSHEIFALLLDFLARSGYEGNKVVTTVSFSNLLGRIADSYGLATIEVPVGFKHVSEAMLAGDVLIGGEESGGAAFGHYLPERDALLMALTLLRAKGEAGVTLHEMLRDVYARFGRTSFVHEDVQLDAERAAELRVRIPSLIEITTVAGESVTGTSDKDGVKLRTGEGWVLVRASGTEPLARFYAEANSKETAQRMIEDVRSKIL
jgi:phosphomannomutase